MDWKLVIVLVLAAAAAIGLLVWYAHHLRQQAATQAVLARLQQEARQAKLEVVKQGAEADVAKEDDDAALSRFNRRGR